MAPDEANDGPATTRTENPSVRSWSTLVTFCALVAIAATVARTLEMLRLRGWSPHGVVTTWTSFSVMWVIASASALLGAAFGARLMNRLGAVLVGGALGGVGAAFANPLPGVLWGLIVGFLVASSSATKVATGLVRLGVALACGFLGGRWLFDVVLSQGSGGVGALAVVIGGCTLQLLILLTRWRRREAPDARRRIRWRRATTCVLTLCGCAFLLVLSWFAGWHTQFRRRVDAIQQGGGFVHYRGPGLFAAAWSRPTLFEVGLRNPTSRDLEVMRWFNPVIQGVSIWGDSVDDQRVSEFPDLSTARRMSIVDTGLTGATLPQLPFLENLTVVDSPMSDAGLLAFVGPSMQAGFLSDLRLKDTDVSGVGLSQWVGTLKTGAHNLSVRDDDWSDADLVAIGRLPIIHLDLKCPAVTEEGWAELLKMTRLRTLRIELRTCSAEVAEALCQLAPSVEVFLKLQGCSAGASERFTLAARKNIAIELEVPDATSLAHVSQVPLRFVSVSSPLRAGDGKWLRIQAQAGVVRIDDNSLLDDLESDLRDLSKRAVTGLTIVVPRESRALSTEVGRRFPHARVTSE